jgi:putative endonuclease
MKCKLKDAAKHSASWFVYIIRCKDSMLYTGITTDLSRRIQAHNSGNGGRFTSCRSPVELLYSEDNFTRPEALKREAVIKSLPRAKKLELIKLNT